MTAPASFKQADVARLIRGAIKGGYAKDEIRLTVAPDGTISLTGSRPANNDDERDTSWDDA